jgi:hypothetical protein
MQFDDGRVSPSGKKRGFLRPHMRAGGAGFALFPQAYAWGYHLSTALRAVFRDLSQDRTEDFTLGYSRTLFRSGRASSAYGI